MNTDTNTMKIAATLDMMNKKTKQKRGGMEEDDSDSDVSVKIEDGYNQFLSVFRPRLQALVAFQEHVWEKKQMDQTFEFLSENENTNEILRARLWIGGEAESSASNPRTILFDAIVSIGDTATTYFTWRDIEYHRIVCYDDEMAPLHKHFDEASEFIHERIQQGKRVLVHCQAGVSRSATICMAYMIRYHHLSWSAAYMCVKDARPRIHPNFGFLTQLKNYEIKQRTCPPP